MNKFLPFEMQSWHELKNLQIVHSLVIEAFETNNQKRPNQVYLVKVGPSLLSAFFGYDYHGHKTSSL